jgi:hypothetical protein
MTQHGLSASQARTVSTTDLIVYNEIDAINREIIAQALLGELQATVSSDTTMTNSTPSNDTSLAYHSVWTNLTDNRKLSLQMTQVANYFQGLGYSILQKQNVATGNTFQWEVYW